MKYLCLIYGSEAAWESLPQDELQAVYAEYGKLGEQYGDRILNGAELQPTSTATSVRVRGGETLVTDGPFAETKEQLGGYYLIDASSLDEALEFAAKIPSARRDDRGEADHRSGRLSVETAFRQEWGRAVAILIRAFGDFDLADHGQSGGRALRRLVV